MIINKHFSNYNFLLMKFFKRFFSSIFIILFLIYIPLFLSSCKEKKNAKNKAIIPLNSVYFYNNFPAIKGYTSTQTGEDLCLFNINIIFVYQANNRRIAREIGKRQLVIIDKVRNLLERFPQSSFIGDNFEELKKLISERINDVLVNGKILGILVDSIDVNPVPREF